MTSSTTGNHPATMEPTEIFLAETAARVLAGESIEKDVAERLTQIKREHLLLLFYYADKIRRQFRGDRVRMCSIINAKSGACSENCAFCAQSAHFKDAPVQVYPLVETDTIRHAAELAAKDGASEFGIVISGWGIRNDEEMREIGEAIQTVADMNTVGTHASLGIVAEERLRYLKERGLTCLNHNLETSERYYGKICTTHSYAERVETVRAAKRVGLTVCCGAIMGMGEEIEDRLDLAFTLRELNVDVVPMNFLHPIPGTPLENVTPMKPLDILKWIAVYRFIMPGKEIKLAGGREKNLRDLQSMIFFAGADSMLVGGYLTTPGRTGAQDMKMLDDLEMPYVTLFEENEIETPAAEPLPILNPYVNS